MNHHIYALKGGAPIGVGCEITHLCPLDALRPKGRGSSRGGAHLQTPDGTPIDESAPDEPGGAGYENPTPGHYFGRVRNCLPRDKSLPATNDASEGRNP